jgi:hypothetical protein
MGTAFASFFAVVTTLFQALQQFCMGLLNVATWVNEASGAFADTSRHDRQVALAKMMEEAGITELPKADPLPTHSATKQLAKPKKVATKAAKDDLIPE